MLSGLVFAVLMGCSSRTFPKGVPGSFRRTESAQTSPEKKKLAVGDSFELSVEVDGVMEIPMHQFRVDSRGIATLPLVGEVQLEGSRLEDARKTIADKYGAYYVNRPLIMLSPVVGEQTGEWGQVTVLGRVGRPGIVLLGSNGGISLTAAIQEAGGFSDSAKTSDIRISRTSREGRQSRVSVNFEEIGQMGNADADLQLIDGDIVYVPERIF
jgi:protein involved in polysaccharide export with SLBB domain